MAPYGAEAAGFDLGGLFHFGPSRSSRATAAGGCCVIGVICITVSVRQMEHGPRTFTTGSRP